MSREYLSAGVWAVLVSSVFGQPVTEQAGDPSGSDDAVRRTYAAVTRFPDTVVTATRTETPISEVGSAVSVVTQQEMEQRQDRLVIDALRFVPGVDIRRNGGLGATTSIFMRGTDSDHTLVLVDGVKLHDASAPTGATILDHLDPFNVDRIEVLRGPQSTLYGSDAIGGVINVITKKGQGDPSAAFTFEVGSWDTYREIFASSGGDKHFNYAVTLSRVDTGGIRAAASDPERDPFRSTSFSGRFGVDISETLGVDFFVRAIDSDIEYDAGTNFGISETEQRQHVFKVQPRAVLFDGFWETTLGVSGSFVDRNNRGSGFTFPSSFDGRIVEIDWQNTLRFGEDNTLTLGVDYETTYGEFNTPFSDFDADMNDVAFYIQDQIRLFDRLFLTLGGRVDRHSDFGTEFTYRAALAYHLKETQTVLRGSYGTGFKAPTLWELFDASFGSNNPSLDAEKTRGFDVGIDQSFFGDRITGSATFFYNDLDNMIVAIFDPGLLAFINTNVEATRTMGVELAATVRVIDDVTARMSYTYTDTEAQEAASFGIGPGSRLLRRPLHKASFDLNWLLLEKKLSLTLSMVYVGSRDDLDPTTFSTVTNEDYVTVNVAALYKVCRNVEVFGRIENLFNEQYQEVLGFNTPDLGVFGGLRVSF